MKKKNSLSYENEVVKKYNKFAYLFIAFHQGLSYISHLALQYFFKDELQIEPSRLAQINSIVHIPWAIKPILGLVTDFLPIFGYRRKVYIILCGLLNLLCWLYMSFYTDTAVKACIMIFLINLTLSFCSILGEAIVVELSQLETENQDSKAKDLVSMFFFAKTLGEVISSYLKGLFVDIMPLRTIFFIACFIPIMLIISGLILVEKPPCHERKNSALPEEEDDLIETQVQKIKSNPESSEVKNSLFQEFVSFICQRSILTPLMFIIIFKATPSFYDPFFYFKTNELKINATDLGKIYCCSSIAVLIAILIYKAYMKDINFKKMIIIGTIISFLISLSCFLLVLRVNIKYGISDFTVLLFATSFMSFVGEFVLLPILSLACVLCPKNLEGTVYSVFMSCLNFGGILSSLNGGILTSMMGITTKNYDNLHWLILISKICTLLPLPMLLCIDDKYFHPEKKIEKNVLIQKLPDSTSSIEETALVKNQSENEESEKNQIK
jgi:folate/biopterin transporter